MSKIDHRNFKNLTKEERVEWIKEEVDKIEKEKQDLLDFITGELKEEDVEEIKNILKL